MISQDEAIAIALDVLYQSAELPDGDEIAITYIEEVENGWYMEANSRTFLETDDPSYAFVTAPIIVHHDGTYRFVF